MKFNNCQYSKPSNHHIFSKHQCDKLFEALLIDDVINLQVVLPNQLQISYTQDQLNECYQISLQLWREGLSRELLKQMIDKIYHQGELNAVDKYEFYCMRAKIKHLRFAYVMFDNKHRFPIMFHWMTASMGYMQDVLKSPQPISVKLAAILVRLFLTKPIYSIATNEFDKFVPSTPENFHLYLAEGINFIASNLLKDKVTSHEFHEVRRVISRLVAFYDCMYVLYPSDDQHAVLLYLSTINGLMGSLHDDLIVAMLNKTQNYYKDTFAMPADIKERLVAYVAFYKSAASA
jgi:hypothetical protein